MPTVQELRQLAPADLAARVVELKRQLFELKSKHNTGSLDSTAELAKTKREIARCLTVKQQLETKVGKG